MMFHRAFLLLVCAMPSVVMSCPYLTDLDRRDDAASHHHHSPPRERASTRGRSHRRLARRTIFDILRSFLNRFDIFDLIRNPTLADAIEDARRDIVSIIDDEDGMEAKFVRLSFHDCVGGCDGCVDLQNKDNTGLGVPIQALQPIVSEYSEFLTRADVWALAGLTAAEVSQDGTDLSFELEFVGRPVCSGTATTGPDRVLPSPHLFTKQFLDYFNTTFGFTARESVAIIGAHTLGRAVPRNSGFAGGNGWVRNRDTLDNEFYTTMLSGGGVDPNFQLELQDNQDQPQFPNQFLWRRGGGRDFMLNSDLSIAVNLDGHLDPVNGTVKCILSGSGGTGNACPTASTLIIAQDYANSNTVWVRDFRDALIKIVNMGCGGGTCTPV